jgi:hypothetical protein
MAALLPQFLDRKTHVELYRRNVEPYFRWAILAVFAALSILGLLNVFGQRTNEVSADAAAAKLTVSAPRAARGGLIYEASFRIDAHSALAKPTLVLDPGWFDGLTINTVEPDAVTWGQKNGRNTVELPPIGAGDHFVLRLQYQVNPTLIGHHTQNLELTDGDAQILTLHRSQIFFP